MQQFVDFVSTKDNRSFSFDKVMFVNALRFLLCKYDPKAAATALPNDALLSIVKPDAKAKSTTAAPKTTPAIGTGVGGTGGIKVPPKGTTA